MRATKPRCSVPGCNNKEARRHCIPSEQRVRDIWLKRIGNLKLDSLNALGDKRSLTRYAVCQTHFSEMCKDANGKLLRFSLPTINLPGFCEDPTPENCFCYPLHEKFAIPENVKEIIAKFDASMPSTSSDSIDKGELSVLRHGVPKRYQYVKRRLPNSLESDTHGTKRQTTIALVECGIEIECRECKIQFNGESVLECEGTCNGWFHIKCANISEKQFSVIKSCEGLRWYCKVCYLASAVRKVEVDC